MYGESVRRPGYNCEPPANPPQTPKPGPPETPDCLSF